MEKLLTKSARKLFQTRVLFIEKFLSTSHYLMRNNNSKRQYYFIKQRRNVFQSEFHSLKNIFPHRFTSNKRENRNGKQCPSSPTR